MQTCPTCGRPVAEVLGGFSIDHEAKTVTRDSDGMQIRLYPRELRLLAAFLKSPELSHKAMLTAMYPTQTYTYKERPLPVIACHLRKKCAPLGLTVKVIRCWGYALQRIQGAALTDRCERPVR
jgi:DNA-binding response OmpR family regulator